jgi:hypothetical protein
VLGVVGKMSNHTAKPPRRRATTRSVATGAVQPHDTEPTRLDALLRVRPSTPEEIAELIGVELARANALVRAARAVRRVLNLGTEDRPIWFVPPGDITDKHGRLREAIAGLIAWRPLSEPELLDLTGARRNVVRGALERLKEASREGGPKILNLGSPGRARWFLRTTR